MNQEAMSVLVAIIVIDWVHDWEGLRSHRSRYPVEGSRDMWYKICCNNQLKSWTRQNFRVILIQTKYNKKNSSISVKMVETPKWQTISYRFGRNETENHAVYDFERPFCKIWQHITPVSTNERIWVGRERERETYECHLESPSPLAPTGLALLSGIGSEERLSSSKNTPSGVKKPCGTRTL